MVVGGGILLSSGWLSLFSIRARALYKWRHVETTKISRAPEKKVTKCYKAHAPLIRIIVLLISVIVRQIGPRGPST